MINSLYTIKAHLQFNWTICAKSPVSIVFSHKFDFSAKTLRPSLIKNWNLSEMQYNFAL